MERRKKILVAPLNWGLGHASRCVPVIKKLLELNVEVIIGAQGNTLTFLQLSFPQLTCIEYRGIAIKYPKNGALLLHFAIRLPQLFRAVKNENQYLKKIAREHNIDGIISDNRYGAFHKTKPSVIITHQLFIESPIFKKTLQQIIHKMISRFSTCWIPDYKTEPNLSGNLSHLKPVGQKFIFIGPLSRFSASKKQLEYKRKVLVLLSGPEPQRTLLEDKIFSELSGSKNDVLIVRGVMSNKGSNTYLKQNIETKDYLLGKELEEVLLSSELIVCRSGYSTIMDLVKLKKKALLIPTPGQTEQEYLANYLSNNRRFLTINQKDLNLENTIKKALEFKPEFETNDEFNADFIEQFLRKC